MSAASSSCQGSFDVFLNFRGEDTRNGFTAYLYEALCNKEIQTFMDADNIVKGEEISPALVTAIHNSMFSVVVLSKNYASSTWCLDELVQILECKKAKKQTVLPIFYDVNPSDVRQQKGSFAEAFAKHEKKFKKKLERVQIWKQALNEVANISGWDARNRHEPTLIKEIIEHISSRLIKRSSKDANAMIGVDFDLSVTRALIDDLLEKSIDDFSEFSDDEDNRKRNTTWEPREPRKLLLDFSDVTKCDSSPKVDSFRKWNSEFSDDEDNQKRNTTWEPREPRKLLLDFSNVTKCDSSPKVDSFRKWKPRMALSEKFQYEPPYNWESLDSSDDEDKCWEKFPR